LVSKLSFSIKGFVYLDNAYCVGRQQAIKGCQKVIYLLPSRQMTNNKTVKALVLSWEYAPLMAGGLGPLIQAAVTEMRNQNIETTVVIPHNLVDSGIMDEDIVSLHHETQKYLRTECIIDGYEFNNFNQFLTQKKHTNAAWPQLYSKKKKKVSKRNLYPNNMPKMSRAFGLAAMDYFRNHQDEYDIVIGPDWHVIPFFHMFREEFSSIPFYFYINATSVDRSIQLKSQSAITGHKMEGLYYNKADAVIAISDISKQILIERYDVDEQKIITVYDDHEYSPSDETIPHLVNRNNKNVFFIGRLSGQKGLGFLLDTAARVIDIDPQITFLIAGEGALLENIVQRIAENHLEKNVYLLGWAGSDDKKRLFNASNLFVMPSPSEPFGLTALEAIKSGVPVISSKTCGFLSVIPSTPTFDYHDTYDFAQKIVYYLQHPDAAQEILDAQTKELHNHSWSKEIGKLKAKILDSTKH
jgi:glycosyltransferase involved in cell wall biosynthesis